MRDLFLTFPILDAVRQELTWTHYRAQIFASKYQLHLPTEQQLLAEVRKELDRFEEEGNSILSRAEPSDP